MSETDEYLHHMMGNCPAGQTLDADLRAVAEELASFDLANCRVAANGPTVGKSVQMAIGDPRPGYQRAVLTVAWAVLEQNK